MIGETNGLVDEGASGGEVNVARRGIGDALSSKVNAAEGAVVSVGQQDARAGFFAVQEASAPVFYRDLFGVLRRAAQTELEDHVAAVNWSNVNCSGLNGTGVLPGEGAPLIRAPIGTPDAFGQWSDDLAAGWVHFHKTIGGPGRIAAHRRALKARPNSPDLHGIGGLRESS